jgi:hypothetical protein
MLTRAESTSAPTVAPQILVDPNSVVIGPYPVTTNVDGYGDVDTFVTMTIGAKSVAGVYQLDIAIDADLSEWRTTVSPLVEHAITAEWKDNCYHPSSFGNFNVSVPIKNLAVINPTTLRIAVDGTATGWYCFPNPIPEIYWDQSGCSTWQVIYGCLKTRSAPDFKGIWLQQGFAAHADVIVKPTDGKSLTLNYDSAVRLGR